MRYYLGIDGGGTKTRFSLCNEKGCLIESVDKKTCHYLQVGFNGVTEVVREGIEDICNKTNINRTDIAYAFAGIPGYGDDSKHVQTIVDAVEKAMNGIKFSIGNDGENALAGSLCCKDGINIVAGTGSIGFGYNSETNTTLKCGGWHQAIGSDEGSGYWMAYHLLHEFTRQIDGRDKKTELYNKVKEQLHLNEDGSNIISVVVVDWKLDRTKIASLSKIVDELYDLGDKYAIEIIDNATKELADIVISLYKRLDFKKQVDVSYSGGIFNMGDKILNRLKKYLSSCNINLITPILRPDKGSLLLALKNDEIEINDEIINNLK